MAGGLVGGPDVWEVVETLLIVREKQPDLAQDALVGATAEAMGLPERRVKVAVRYYTAYRAEVAETAVRHAAQLVVLISYKQLGFVRGACEYRGVTVAVCEPVQVISSCLENLRGGLVDDEIVQTLREIEQLCRKAHSVMLDVVAEAELRGIAARTGFGTTLRMLSAILWVSAAEARTRTEHAALVGPRQAMTGQLLEPRLPVTAAALTAGQIGLGS